MEDYFRQYGLVLLLAGFAAVVPAGMLVASWLSARLGLRPQRPTSVKLEMYECGMEPIGGKWIQFNFRYYLFALLFLVFDVLGVLLYPWAVELRHLSRSGGMGVAALGGVLVFVGLLTVGWMYAWKKKGLEWR